MSTTARTLLFLFCAAAGVGVALALAAIEPDVALSADDADGRGNSAPSAATGSHRDTAEATRRGEALETPPQPAITRQVPPTDTGSEAARRRDETVAESMVEVVKAVLGHAAQQQQPPPAASGAAAGGTDNGPEEVPAAAANTAGQAAAAQPTPATRLDDEGDGRITLHCRGSELREVLELLSQQGGMNILPSKNVAGQVTASLPNVSIEEALDVIVKSAGYMWRRDGRFIHVGTRDDLKAIDQAGDRVTTRVYRPNYITAKDLEQLITPLLTPGVGVVKAASPSQVGIAADGASAGGDNYAGAEAVVVRDYENVLASIDQLIGEMDRRPPQVAIEAMILSVRLDDEHRFGVDFEFLRTNDHVRLGTGSPLNTLGEITFDSGGLKFGYLDANLAMFLDAVETIGDANIIATPRVLCLNRQRAEILIGAQLGYVNTTQTETSSTQSVDFLEVGTQLRIRPFIASDGMVRMEVHPELSTGTVRVEQNFTLPDKDVTQVTSNIMVRDGSTVVIGGLIRDEVTTSGSQVPLLGSLPLVGPAFRRMTQTIERREIIVLITPHIVYEPEIGIQGDKAAREFHHRHMAYADQLSPIGKRHLGRRYFHQAQRAWRQGDQDRALWLVNLSIHFDPLSRAALDLRADITSNNPQGDHTDVHPPRVGPNLYPLDGELLAPWMIDELGRPPLPLRHPVDPGAAGPSRDIAPQAAP